MKQNHDKPTLESLFESKKLDLPSDVFWEELQNRVKGRALASLSRHSISRRLYISSALLAPAILFVISFFVLNDPVANLDSFSISNPEKSNGSLPKPMNPEDVAILMNLESREYELISVDSDIVSFDSSASSSFVKEEISLPTHDTFDTEFLSNVVPNRLGPTARFTF